jgi:PAS fold
VIYSFKASGDFAPTFVSDNIGTVFGYTPAEYLENPSFWPRRVHPDDLERSKWASPIPKNEPAGFYESLNGTRFRSLFRD